MFDFGIKAVCYQTLFMLPVSSFGIISLIEFWFRYGCLAQTWLLLTSYIKEVRPTPSGAIYMPANGSTSRNSQIVRRNNSSIWEKPSLLPKRTASTAPNLHDISEHSDTYKENTITYKSHNSHPDIHSTSPSRSRRSSRGISRSHRANSRQSSRDTSRHSRPNSIHKDDNSRYSSHTQNYQPSQQDYRFDQNSHIQVNISIN